ncbi:creatininase family protein [cf. Phormidesmis sp. LEGE 11477]|uniref:creatininase family protein n=1 Tax=cf. Phormidesmis sp. LEGE 11477 TaxID=1828680 RepID=UPI001882D586|nr:creatininase family protein [cf. Phormidesmis sp. LEGE 11477]MBE9063969.1 creatininase family protein [cf. Phormidesmis sp. LEGE 11477]
MLLHLSTWPEVEEYLTRSRGIIFPIGSTEQHGPTGLIGTDAICAEAVAKGVGDATGALVGPTINVGMALHHLAFPGSVSLRPSTLIALIQDYVKPLARHGFERFYFINGHGGNVASMKAAFSETYAAIADANLPNAGQIRCKVANWYQSKAVVALTQQLYGDQEGSHATPSEVALTQFVYPEDIKQASLSPAIAPSGRSIYNPTDFRAFYPDGRMGSNPELATPEHGQQFYEIAVKDLTHGYLSFLQES